MCLFLLMRVGACADELRLMGVGRRSVTARCLTKIEKKASLARKKSSALSPPVIERMWFGPWGEGNI